MGSLIKSSLLYQGTKDKEDTSKHPCLDRSQPFRLWSICDISLILYGSVSPLGCWLWLYWRCWQGRGRGWRGGPSCQGWRPWGWGKRSRKQSLTDLHWIDLYFLKVPTPPIFRGHITDCIRRQPNKIVNWVPDKIKVETGSKKTPTPQLHKSTSFTIVFFLKNCMVVHLFIRSTIWPN